jgi:V/A-type H+/Na+-transporting ATPase subunit A
MKEEKNLTIGKISGIIANLVIVEVNGPVSQNEICYIKHSSTRLMAEVIKVQGNKAYIQVFESTRGLKTGIEVEFSQNMLEVSLGPGILSKNYDGLQHDLDLMEGVFLQRGDYTAALDSDKLWQFKPLAKSGDLVKAGDWLGKVDENFQPHKIMVPFKLKDKYTVKEVVSEGEYKINDTIAVITDNKGKEMK